MNDYGYDETVELVKKYLDEEGLHYEEEALDSLTVFKGFVGEFEGLYKTFAFRMFVRADDIVQFDAVFPACDLKKTPEIAEFIVRANHGLKYGAFDLDPSDGEITFHMSFPSDLVHADRDWVGFMLVCALQTLAQYAKGLTAVLMEIKSPEAAVADCEKCEKNEDDDKDDEEADD